MNKMFKNNWEKGLTLIEVLASLVIVSIVLISFSGILIQSMKHTKYNKEKLTEVDIAEEIVGKIREELKTCEEIEAEVEQPDYKTHYKVELACDQVPEEVALPSHLKRAVIKVTSTAATSQKKSPFITETYYKVGVGQ